MAQRTETYNGFTIFIEKISKKVINFKIKELPSVGFIPVSRMDSVRKQYKEYINAYIKKNSKPKEQIITSASDIVLI